MNKQLILFYFVSVIVFCSCDRVSILDTKVITDVSILGAEIEILEEQEMSLLKPDSLIINSYFKVVLFDPKHIDVQNPTLRVFVNNKEMALEAETRSMNTHPYYILREAIDPEKAYYFTLALSNKKTHSIGIIKTQKKIGFNNFNFPKVHSRKSDLKIEWYKIEEPSALYICREFKDNDSTGIRNMLNESRYSPFALRTEPGPRTIIGLPWFSPDHYKIPASHFQVEKEKVTNLKVEFETVKEGIISKELLKHSYAKSIINLKKNIFIVD